MTTNLDLLNNSALKQFVSAHEAALQAERDASLAQRKAETDKKNAEVIAAMTRLTRLVRSFGIPANIMTTYTRAHLSGNDDRIFAKPVILLGAGMFLFIKPGTNYLYMGYKVVPPRISTGHPQSASLGNNLYVPILHPEEALPHHLIEFKEKFQTWLAESIKDVLNRGDYIQWAIESQKRPPLAQQKARSDYQEAYRLYRLAKSAEHTAEFAANLYRHGDVSYRFSQAAQANYLNLLNKFPIHIRMNAKRSWEAHNLPPHTTYTRDRGHYQTQALLKQRAK